MTTADSRMSRVGFVLAATASIVAEGLFVWPLHVVVAAGQNAILAVGITGGWTVAIALAHPAALPSVPRLRHAFRVLDILGWMVLGTVDTVMIVSLMAMLKTFYFFETPLWALLLPFCAVVGWAAAKPRATVNRLATFWVPILFVGSLIVALMAMSHIHYPRTLLPNQAVDGKAVVQATAVMAYMVAPVGLTLRGLATSVQTPPTTAVRLWGPLLAWSFLLALYLLVVGTLGPNALIHLRWPIVFMLDQITLDSAFFISRVGIAVIFGWTLGIALGLIIHVDLIGESAQTQWTHPATRGVVAGSVTCLWFFAALFTTTPATASRLLLSWLDPAAIGYLGIEAALLFIVAIIRRTHTSKAKESD